MVVSWDRCVTGLRMVENSISTLHLQLAGQVLCAVPLTVLPSVAIQFHVPLSARLQPVPQAQETQDL